MSAVISQPTQSSGTSEDHQLLHHPQYNRSGKLLRWTTAILALAIFSTCSPAVSAADTTTTSATTPAATHHPASSATNLLQNFGQNGGSEIDSDTFSDNGDHSSVEEDAEENVNGGDIGIVGSFSGISSFTPGNMSSAALELSSGDESLISLSQSSASVLESSKMNGQITTACSIYNSDGSVSKTYFGGSLMSLNQTPIGYVAAIDSSGHIDTMHDGVYGPINTLYCDQDLQMVYVGGNFSSTVAGLTASVATARSQSSGNMAIYSHKDSAWQYLPFHGLDGPVFDFARINNDVFAVGSFSATQDNATHVALNTQPVNLAACQIVGGNNAETVGFTDPMNAICTQHADQAGNTWLMRDKLPGYYRIVFPFKTTPSLLRIMNTGYEGRGTKAFRMEAVENNQVLQMAYINPATKMEVTCTQSCPLDHTYNWQEFRFVADPATLSNITGVTIQITDWYGMGGGFNKIELYQRDPRVYGDNSFNTLPCNTEPFKPSSTKNGNWVSTTPASYHGTYLTLSMPKSDVSTAQSANASMTLVPYIPESGFYNIYMMLPGCQNTNTCVDRASVKVQIQLSKQLSIVSTFKQDNVLDNEFLVHRGYIARTSNDFKMTIKVSIDSGSVINALASNAEIVVDYFRMERDTSYKDLNGVIKFNKDLNSTAQDFGPIYTPLEMTLPQKSVVRSAVVGKPNATDSQDTLYLGGRFSNSTANYHNVVQYIGNTLKPLNNTGGIEGMVFSMAFVNSSLFVGGTFNGTADHNTELTNVAQFSTTDNKWYSLGAGVNGLVDTVVPYAPFGPSTIALHGNFGTLLTNNDSPNSNNITVNGVAMWDMSVKEWSYTPYAKGTVTMLHSDPWKNHTTNHALLAGSLSAVAAIEASGALLLDQKQSIRPFGKLDTSLLPNDAGKLALSSGLWYAKKNGTKARLVVGGQFKTPDGASNVAILDNGKWSRLMDDVDGEVLTINNAANLLFVGGIANTTGNKGNTYYSGLIVYDMDKDKVVDNIQELQGNDGGMTDVRINKVAIRADTSTVVVGGNFTTAGALPCSYICALDINEWQWSPISNTLVDQVTDMLYSRNSLFVAGTFQNGTSGPILHLMQYSFDTNSWDKLNGASSLPGPVHKITPAFSAQSSEAFYITGLSDGSGGSPYLAMYDGSSVEMATFNIGSKSIISSILEVPLSRVPDSVLGKSDNKGNNGSSLHRRSSGNILSPGYVLAVSGDLHLPDGQRASSAFFFNNQWAPFLSSVQSDGSPGFISSVFYEIPPASVYQRYRLSVALVILIAVAIALGITFLIVLVGLVYIYLRNRREAAATASAASAAMAATTAAGGGARTIGKSMHTGGGIGQAAAAATAGAGAGGALATMSKNNRVIDSSSGGANNRDTWGDDNGLAAETVSFDNIAPKTDRLMSSGQAAAVATAGLAGLAAASGSNSRQGPVMSSETYVQSYEGGGSKGGKNNKDENNESLDSIFESAVAEADAEERERAASTGSLGEVAGGAAVAGGLAAGAAAAKKHAVMPEPHHYTSGNEQPPLSSSTGSHSQTSMYRPDSTNPFEQRMAMRESQGNNGGAFPPAGPFSEGGGDEHGMGHIPMPSPRHLEHSAELAAAGVVAGAVVAGGAKSSRHRSETESTRNTDRGIEGSSSSHSLTSRPSGESSTNGSSAHLPVRDSLKQYPVYYAKFTFNSRETGELGFRAGERVFVIDQSDEIWWMGIVDRGSDQPLEQGVFPATYVSSEPQQSQEWDETG